jgi:hypothetical protein
MRRIPVTPSLLVAFLALFALAPGARAAGGVSLRWDSCYGDGGVQNKSFACDTNTGSATLVGSFTPGADISQVSGNFIVLDLGFAGATTPQWWWLFFNFVTCRKTSLTFSRTAPGACVDWTAGQAVGGISAYNIGVRGPNTARLAAITAVPPNALADLFASQEYFSFSLTIDYQKTVGDGSCAGCASPGCLVTQFINLTTPNTATNRTLSGPANGTDSDWATWQRGAGVVVGGAVGCPAATPTAKRTWGAVKALYR